MKWSQSRTSGFLAVAAFAGLLMGLSGCVETSLVIKVKQDGSGVLHLRSHQKEATIGLVRSSPKDDEDAKSTLPSQDRLDRMTKHLGDGVKLLAAESSKNRSGWNGYDLIWEFQDINQVTLTNEFSELLASDAQGKDNGKQQAPGKKAKSPIGLRFAMEAGTLEIHIDGFEPPKDKEKDLEKIGAVDPFADKPAGASGTFTMLDSVTQEIAVKMLSDARAGFFIQVDGEIESTNAKHREDHLITIMSVNLGELLQDPETRQQINNSTPPSREELQAFADAHEGLDLDLQKPLRVKIR